MNIHPSRQAYVEEEDGAVRLIYLLCSLSLSCMLAQNSYVLCKMTAMTGRDEYEANQSV
jgi:hypothetical protein